MNSVLRFLLACLAATVTAVLAIDLVWPFVDLFTSEGERNLIGAMGSAIELLPWVFLFGAIVALPLAAVAGGALLAFENGRGQPLPRAGWLGTGLAAGLLTALLLSSNTDIAGRIVIAVWFSVGGLLAAWAFRRVWHAPRRT